MSPFLSACGYVADLLGPADALRARTVTAAGVLPALARWGRDGGISLTVTDGANDLVATLRAERLDGDFREWRSIGEYTVRDACGWLGWTVPRPTLPGIAHCASVEALLAEPPDVRDLGPCPVEHRTAPPFAVEGVDLDDAETRTSPATREHSAPFLAALAVLTPHLGAPSRVDHLPLLASVAEWERDGAAWTLDDYAGEVCLTATLPDGRDYGRIIDPPEHTAEGALRRCLDALARLASRPAPVGYDGNGSPVDDGCGGDQRSTTRGALGEGDW